MWGAAATRWAKVERNPERVAASARPRPPPLLWRGPDERLQRSNASVAVLLQGCQVGDPAAPAAHSAPFASAHSPAPAPVPPVCTPLRQFRVSRWTCARTCL